MSENALLAVRVTPRSVRDEVAGYSDGVVRVRLRAPPVEGRANESLLRLLAERLGVSVRNLEIVSGATGRTKRVRVAGMSAQAAIARLTPR